MTTTSQKVFRNTLIQTLGRVAIMVAGLLSISVLTRMLGVEGYGIYTAAMVFISFFISFTDWGIPTIMARDMARDSSMRDRLLSTALIGRTLIALPTMLLVILVGHIFYPSSILTQQAIAITALSLLSNAGLSCLIAYSQARLETGYMTLAEVISRFVSLGLIVYGSMMHWNLLMVVVISVVGGFVHLTLLSVFISSRVKVKAAFDSKLFRSMLASSIPLGAAVILNAIYFKVDAVILSLMRPAADVGIYGIAYKVLELLLIFPSLFATTILPVLSAQAGNLDRFRGVFARAYDVMVLVSVPLLFGGLVTAPAIVHIIGGDGFEAAAMPLRILLGSTIFTFVNILIGLGIVALDRQRKALWVNVGALVINICLNIILIPTYGYNAAAAVTLVTELFITATTLGILRKYSGINLLHLNQLKMVLAGAIMALVLWQIHGANLLLQIVIGGAIYIALILSTKAVKISELREVVSIGRPTS